MSRLEIPTYETQKELFAFLKANKEQLIAEKREEIKLCDYDKATETFKGDLVTTKVLNKTEEEGVVTVKIVANSTNVLDSHNDVHVKGNYDESIRLGEGMDHRKNHSRGVEDNVGIVQEVKAEDIPFRDLGIDKNGSTECLVYTSKVMKILDEKIYNRYKIGLINQHSIGMKYRDFALAMNDEDSKEEKALWDEYIDQIANPGRAIKQGFFWVVKNIELIECSAVMKGSNSATPTLSAKAYKDQAMEEIKESLKAQKTIIINQVKRNKRKRIK